MGLRRVQPVLAVLFTYLLSYCNALSARQVVTTPSIPNGHWVDTWTAMPQLTEYTNLPPPPYVCSPRYVAKLVEANTSAEHKHRAVLQQHHPPDAAHVDGGVSDQDRHFQCFRAD